MFQRLYRRHPHGPGWFARARLVVAACAGTMVFLALCGGLALQTGWMDAATAAWFGYSLLPLAGLFVLQTAARMQEALTMRFGGRPVEVETV